jgi:hypothetical protein
VREQPVSIDGVLGRSTIDRRLDSDASVASIPLTDRIED